MADLTPNTRRALIDFRRSVYRAASKPGRVKLDPEPLRRGILQTLLKTYRDASGGSVNAIVRKQLNGRAKDAARSLSDYATRESRKIIKDLRKSDRNTRNEFIADQLDRVGLSVDNFYRLDAILHTLQTDIIEYLRDQETGDYWGWSYQTADDEKVRATHRPMHRIARYPKGHKFWDRWTPPNGFNCRCRRKIIRRKPKGWKEIPLDRWPPPDAGFDGKAGSVSGLGR